VTLAPVYRDLFRLVFHRVEGFAAAATGDFFVHLVGKNFLFLPAFRAFHRDRCDGFVGFETGAVLI